MDYDNPKFPPGLMNSTELAIMDALKTVSAARGMPFQIILLASETILLKLRLLKACGYESTRKLPGTEFARIYHGYEVEGLDGRMAMASLQPHVEASYESAFDYHRETLSISNTNAGISNSGFFGSRLFIGNAIPKTIDPKLLQNLGQGVQAGHGGLPGQVPGDPETDADGLSGVNKNVNNVQNDSGGTSAATPANTTADQIPAVGPYNFPDDYLEDIVGEPQPETVNPADLML
ncbi:hypothetical protein CMUS01_12850 [Colletotrichum musicola]|uniref:Uncharacterized protein n=1 Tax=Colletotrichum musicola TaxID=2175873 RepID=A0A8H6JHP3_9PEZI|nr:hypothetical protein CMUS01_12850 [Colletotrichum musicola]